MKLRILWMGVLVCASAATAAEVLVIEQPMTPPAWALMERALLAENSRAAEAFAEPYLDSRGYLLHTPRWGTLDGPDDAIETFYNWTLPGALGGSPSVIELYNKAHEGHLRQYGELRTVKTELAANGAYHQEFITMSDWFHTGEGMRAFFLWGLAEPEQPLLARRMQRFAGLYMHEDPDAPNYDPQRKLIKSIWNGDLMPATTDHLVQLTMGGYFASGRIWVLHSRLRNFDPDRRRSGLPEDVAALVERLEALRQPTHAGAALASGPHHPAFPALAVSSRACRARRESYPTGCGADP